MNKKLNEIIKTVLFGTNEEINRIALNYDVTLDELKKLNDYFQIQDSDALSVAQVMDIENYYPNSNISTIVFHNYIIEVLEDLNKMLEV
ncbi:hypothetical protein [Staphylococcus virus vB_SurM-PSU6]|nr:hypothetical protein [Staphylococcus virus vB_SurM-PSU6]